MYSVSKLSYCMVILKHIFTHSWRYLISHTVENPLLFLYNNQIKCLTQSSYQPSQRTQESSKAQSSTPVKLNSSIQRCDIFSTIRRLGNTLLMISSPGVSLEWTILLQTTDFYYMACELMYNGPIFHRKSLLLIVALCQFWH